jgi:thioredoxin reductase (NADPH)
MYDIAIIGGGPAGLTAAIYAVRYKLNAITISPEYGGKVKHAHSIENWPGEKSITGTDLSDKLYDHAKHVKAELETDYVQSIENTNNVFHISTNSGKYEAKRIIFTVGTEREKLGIPGEEKYFGKGVSYSTAIDGQSYKNKIVIVVGSGDSACTSAVFMANIAKKVYLMYRSSSLKAEPIWIDQVKNNPKIETLPTIMPAKIIGNTKVKQVVCSDGRKLEVDGIFIEVGSTPSEFLINKLGLKTDDDGYIIVDNNQKTNINNVWAAGDITTNSGKFKQIITSAAEGAVAVSSIYTDSKLKKPT